MKFKYIYAISALTLCLVAKLTVADNNFNQCAIKGGLIGVSSWVISSGMREAGCSKNLSQGTGLLTLLVTNYAVQKNTRFTDGRPSLITMAASALVLIGCNYVWPMIEDGCKKKETVEEKPHHPQHHKHHKPEVVVIDRDEEPSFR